MLNADIKQLISLSNNVKKLNISKAYATGLQGDVGDRLITVPNLVTARPYRKQITEVNVWWYFLPSCGTNKQKITGQKHLLHLRLPTLPFGLVA